MTDPLPTTDPSRLALWRQFWAAMRARRWKQAYEVMVQLELQKPSAAPPNPVP